MNFFIKNKQVPVTALKIISLAMLPLLLIFIAMVLKHAMGPYFLNSIDPEYSYLFNGLNLAHLNFPWHIDHPGTPLQILSALVIRVVHLLHNHQIPIDNDVFLYPEVYLSAIVSTIYYLNGIALFFIGYIICQYSDSLGLGIFFQLAPFMSGILLSILSRILVEHLIIFHTLCLTSLIFLYIQYEKKNQVLIDKYLILFSIIIGIGLATKITFLPLFLIPLMILRGIKKKAFYSLFVLITFSIFAFPIFNRWVPFRDWVENLFMHSGIYGNGPKTIIESGRFLYNLNRVFTTEFVFPIVFFLLILGCILYYLPAFKLKRKNDIYLKCLIGIISAMSLMVILVAKQYKYFYLTPVLMFMILGLYLLITIYFRQTNFFKKTRLIIPSFLIFIAFILIYDFRQIFNLYATLKKRSSSYEYTMKMINTE